jgi:hypothetical protein
MAKGKPISSVGRGPVPGPWTNLLKTKSLPTEGLVYEVRATDGNGNAVPVTYAGITDLTGMIYIGELADTPRVNDLLKGFQTHGKDDPHGAATKFFKEGLDTQYPVDQLEIRVTPVDQSAPAPKSKYSGLFDKPVEKGKPSDAKVAARVNERGLLHAFEYTHKRLPPLNKKRGYHTKKPPLAPSAGEVDPVDDDLVEMDAMSDEQKQKARDDHEVRKKQAGKGK